MPLGEGVKAPEAVGSMEVVCRALREAAAVAEVVVEAQAVEVPQKEAVEEAVGVALKMMEARRRGRPAHREWGGQSEWMWEWG